MIFEQARHKPDCTNIDDGQILEILDLEIDELYYPCRRRVRNCLHIYNVNINVNYGVVLFGGE